MRSLVGFGLCAFLFAAACNGELIGSIGADSGPGSPDSGPGSPDSSLISPSPEASTDAPNGNGTCCPIDPQPAGCMYMGGSTNEDAAMCGRSCDFFCSENWRMEKTADGCDEWKYDVRQPAPGEGPQCNPLDGGSSLDAAPWVDAAPSVDAAPDAQTGFACGTAGMCITAAAYCFATTGGVQDTYDCKPLPTKCISNKTCACIEPWELPACNARPGLPTCTEDNGAVTVGCSF